MLTDKSQTRRAFRWSTSVGGTGSICLRRTRFRAHSADAMDIPCAFVPSTRTRHDGFSPVSSAGLTRVSRPLLRHLEVSCSVCRCIRTFQKIPFRLLNVFSQFLPEVEPLEQQPRLAQFRFGNDPID